MNKSVVSGVHPNNTYPLVDGQLDPEQKRRLAARQDSERVRGLEPTTEEKLVSEHPQNSTPNTPSQENPTGATSPEEVVQDVREQVAAPVENAPTPEVQSTTVQETNSTTVTEAATGDASAANNQ